MKYIVWDWNGTLLNDVPLCLEVENQLLERRGLPPLTGERYREIFTFPVRDYYQAAGLDLEREAFEEVAREFVEEYNRRVSVCGLCPGAEEALEYLREKGWRQIIVSASERRALTEQVEACGISSFFEDILGVGDVLASGKAGLAQDYFRDQGAAKTQALFVGDTVHDWETAREMGCRCVLAAGGHQSRARLESTGGKVLESLWELPRYLELLR